MKLFHSQALQGKRPYSRPTPQGPTALSNSIGMPFVSIPAGCFKMGSPGEDAEDPDWEQPQHAVTIAHPFRLGVYPVTQHEYERVMANNPSHFRHDAACPVEHVSWFDAIEFCNRLSDLEALTPYYHRAADEVRVVGGPGYRLPTEAEWEYACRAGTTTKYFFGDEARLLGEYAWHEANSGHQTQPVGAKQPNAWGVYDMHGNVWEWCQNWWSENYGSDAAVVDPSGPATGKFRVDRGGCWGDSAWSCRSAVRDGIDPSGRDFYLGFRVALNWSGPESGK